MSRFNFRKCLLCVFVFFTAYQNSLLAKEHIVLQLRWDHQFQFAGYYMAKLNGHYEKAGFHVGIRSAVKPDGKILSAIEEVAAKRAEFGVGAADILVALDKGQKLKICASIFQESASRFYTREDTGQLTPVRFKELKAARRVNDLIDIELQALLLAEGIDPASITPYKHIPGLQHLISRQVDIVPGYAISVPIEAKEAGIKLNVLNPADYGIHFYG
ncbi:MAG: ABC transporter substrate-binding protein, partial [Planctomycetota bacterium]